MTREQTPRVPFRGSFLDPSVYHVAWVAPLEIEARAALAMLDQRHHGRFEVTRGIDYIYKAGQVGDHNVVIATFPAGQEYGTNSAAALASQIKVVFPNIRFALLVGVAAGLPSPARDIRLGDVLVAMSQNDRPAVVDYELGKELETGFQPLRNGHVLASVPPLLGAAMGSLRLEPDEAMSFMLDCYEQAFGTDDSFADPGQYRDVLSQCRLSGTNQVPARPQRGTLDRTNIWYGAIGSGNRLLRNAVIRDELRDRYDLIGLEMEAAGMMNRLPTGVIRGVCDYADDQKNKEWQPYAAAMAASYAKSLLAQIPSHSGSGSCHNALVTSSSRPSSQEVPPVARKKSRGLHRADMIETIRASKPTLAECLRSLQFLNFTSRVTAINDPAPRTCHWILKDTRFVEWSNTKYPVGQRPLLWIKGKPGAGKSTIAKYLARFLTSTQCVVKYFFDGQGDTLQRSTLGMLRSLVYHLVKDGVSAAEKLQTLGREKLAQTPGPTRVLDWGEKELKSLLIDICSDITLRPTVLLIDGLDECQHENPKALNPGTPRDIVGFFQDLLELSSVAETSLRICVTSRSVLKVGLSSLEIVLDQDNREDIEMYITSHLQRHIQLSDAHLDELKVEILFKSRGIFLWVKLVLDKLLPSIDYGRPFSHVLRELKIIPTEMADIYREVVSNAFAPGLSDKAMTARFFHWIVFGARPIRLREWYSILGLIQDQSFFSLKSWQENTACPSDDTQLENQIRHVSMGLVEVTPARRRLATDADSVEAGPGSMISDMGETRIVRIIHSSVIDFMLAEGFNTLHGKVMSIQDTIAAGHMTIIDSCFRYISTEELARFVEARRGHLLLDSAEPSGNKSTHRGSSVSSFESAASSRGGPSRSGTPLQTYRPSPVSSASFIEGKSHHKASVRAVRFQSMLHSLSQDPSGRTTALRRYLTQHNKLEKIEYTTCSASEVVALASSIRSTSLGGNVLLHGEFAGNAPGSQDQQTHYDKDGTLSGIQSISVKTQVLGFGDITALLEYARSTIFQHLNNAEVIQIHGVMLMRRLAAHWEPMVLLRDDLRRSVTLTQYCLENRHEHLFKAILDRDTEMALYDLFVTVCSLGMDWAAKTIIARQFQVLANGCVTRKKQEWLDLLKIIIKGNPVFGIGLDYEQLFWTWKRLASEVRSDIESERLEASSLLGPTSSSYLAQACKVSRLEVGKILVQDFDADVMSPHDGRTALEWLCTSMVTWNKEVEEFVLFLVQNGADMKSSSALSILCKENFMGDDPIRFFLEHGSLANGVGGNGEIPLHSLCSNEPTTELELLGPLVSSSISDVARYKSLIRSWDTYERSVRLLLGRGANANAIDASDGRTPLHRLFESPDRLFPLASLLVESGGDFRLRDLNGRSPSFLAYCVLGRWRASTIYFVATLDSRLPDLDYATQSPLFALGLRPFKTISTYRMQLQHSLDVQRAFVHVLGLGFDVNAQNIHGETVLFLICSRPGPRTKQQINYTTNIVKELLAAGADPDRVPAGDSSCLHHLARHARRRELAALISHCGCQIDAQNAEGLTPLFEAVLTSDEEENDVRRQLDRLICVRLLVTAGASVTHRNGAGLDVFDIVRSASGRYNEEHSIQATLENILESARKPECIREISDSSLRSGSPELSNADWRWDIFCCYPWRRRSC